MKVVFVRTPRYRWVFHSEHSSFWQPLGFASIAAVLRENTDVELRIIDCPVLKMGWESAKRAVLEEEPDIVCVGEETVSAHEALKLARFCKDRLGCVVIAGGPHFSYMLEDTLKNHPVDYIVRFEGEYTLLELVKLIRKDRSPSAKELKKVRGIAFLHRGSVYETGLRPLLDMEGLPMPAYDLLPMDEYGKGASSHPDLVAIEHSRGCTCSCNFCVLWKQFGQVDLKNKKVYPCYRTKSPEKAVAEVKHLAEKYGRKTFCWVDPTFNVDPEWNQRFAELLIKEGLDVDHSAWMRADYLVRDEEKGVFSKLVDAGLKQVMVGVERTDNDDLAYLDKSGYSYATVKKAFEVVRGYDEVLSVATYIYGLPNETKQSLRRFYDLLSRIPFDIGVPIPITPNPGTKFFDELMEEGLLEVKTFKYYNFINPIARSKYLGRNRLLFNMLLNEFRIRTRREQFAKYGLSGRRRNATGNLAMSKTYMVWRFLRGIVQEEVFGKLYNYNVRPEWYGR